MQWVVIDRCVRISSERVLWRYDFFCYLLMEKVEDKHLMPAVAGTWPFSLPCVEECYRRLSDHTSPLSVTASVVEAIRSVELDPAVQTVGSHSYPNVNGLLQLDAAIIEVSAGRHRCGAVMALEGYRGAIEGAFTVMESSPHPILVGKGAAQFLHQQGMEAEEGPIPVASTPDSSSPCASHDTVGVLAVRDGVLTVGCSSSGKRNKLSGRVGDSPIFGSGLYAEGGVGGAVCTGDGDKICSFPLAFTAVSLMRSGHPPQTACDMAMTYFLTLPQGDATVEVAILALDVHGNVGASTSPAYTAEFTFSYVSDNTDGNAQLYTCQILGDH